MDVQEVRKLDAYLKRVFGNPKIRVVPRPKKDDSAEVYIGEEFIGVLFVDDEDDDRSFQFQMAILEEDLVRLGSNVGWAKRKRAHLESTGREGGHGAGRLCPPYDIHFFRTSARSARSIAVATSRHCASQLRGKRKIRSAPSMRRSDRHMPGVAASRVHRALIAGLAAENMSSLA